LEKEKRLAPVNFDSYKPLRELVLEALREAILNGTLQPRERLMEIQLAEELGVSRTPIREALRKLELEGFIIMIPRKGAYVADFSLRDLEDTFEVRKSLEGLAAELCAERATEEEIVEMEQLLQQKAIAIENNDMAQLLEVDTAFHEILYRASRNERLRTIISNLREQIERFRIASLQYPGRMKRSLEEHRAILAAIRARDGKIANHLAQDHIENVEIILLEKLRHSHE
jgi:DNA-binding GntR family transcriptional regulator